MKKKVTLYSLNEKEYKNIEVEAEVIEDSAKQLDEFTDKEVVEAIKYATVQAYPAKAGKTVDTRPRVNYDNHTYTFSETKQTVSPEKEASGAMVVKNPDGEEYLISSREKFFKKYEETYGGYRAIDGVKKFRKANKNVIIKTSWGEEQVVLKGSMICVSDTNDIYSVTNAAFSGTYTTDKEKIKDVLQEREDKLSEQV